MKIARRQTFFMGDTPEFAHIRNGIERQEGKWEGGRNIKDDSELTRPIILNTPM